MNSKTRRLKYACYTANISMSVVSNLSPVLFLTFRSLYGISYSLLGLLVLINFVTQLVIDLIFSFFSHKFNIAKAVKFTPFLTAAGIIIYAVWPWVFPNCVYAGLVAGTVIFSAASGFNEVLISPVIAAIPADDPDREMSKLHSIYAWGVVFVITVSTLFLLFAGGENWQYLALFFLVVPVLSALLFAGAEIPQMETPQRISGVFKQLKNKTLWLCVFAIFLGGAAECTIAQWSSSYLEQSLGIPKVWGDIFGVALFAVALGVGRSWYAKKGKNIEKTLFFGAVGAAVCYLTAALSPLPIIGLLACAFTGFCVSMLWPGNLVSASARIPHGGVFLFAMMAAGGDLGASVGPQIIGVITDTVISIPTAAELSAFIGITPEQLGMKIGVLAGMMFPLVAIPVNLYLWKKKPKQ